MRELIKNHEVSDNDALSEALDLLQEQVDALKATVSLLLLLRVRATARLRVEVGQ